MAHWRPRHLPWAAGWFSADPRLMQLLPARVQGLQENLYTRNTAAQAKHRNEAVAEAVSVFESDY